MLIGNVWIYRLLFVILFVCMVTYFSVEHKPSGIKFCTVVYRRPGQGISHFGELCYPQSPKSDICRCAICMWAWSYAWPMRLPVRPERWPCVGSAFVDKRSSLKMDALFHHLMWPSAAVEDRHHCRRLCHTGACGPCDGVTSVECRCRGQTTELPCSEVVTMRTQDSQFTCDRRCNKKMSCGRHKCGQYCCISSQHQCRLVCGCELTHVGAGGNLPFTSPHSTLLF